MILTGIVDDHPAMILGTTAILNGQSDIRVVAVGATVRQLLARVRRLDVVLLDLSLSDGSNPTDNIRALYSLRAHILAYTSGDKPGLIREAARAGAVGMIRKSERMDVVVQSVRSTAHGQVVASAEWATALESDADFVAAHLSARESQVLALYALGETAQRVAATLFISRETVLDHIRRVRAKYAAVDRAAPTKVDLFRRAVEDGFVSAE